MSPRARRRRSVAHALLRGDVIFRAVALPPGRHVVHFRFEPFAGAISDLARLAGLVH